jgi:hypothetical protein
MKQAISGAMADRKRTMKIEPKNKGKNGSQIEGSDPLRGFTYHPRGAEVPFGHTKCR